MERFALARAGEEVVREVVTDVLTSVFDTIDVKYIESVDLDLAVDLSMIKLHRLAIWADYRHDGIVAAVVDEDEAMEYMAPDEEPQPVAVDPWARGLVHIKKVSAADAAHYKAHSGSETPSVSSYKSSVYGKSSRKTSSTNFSKRSGTGSKDSRGTIIDVELDAKFNFENLNETGHMFDMLNKARKIIKTDKGQIIGDAMKDPVEKGKAKPSGVVVDVDGRPIALEPVKTEALPPYAVPTGYTVSSYTTEAVDPKAGGGKKKKVARVAGSRVVEDSSHFTASNSFVSQLADNIRFPLNPGVSLRSNGGVREGPPVESNPRKISRKEYFSKSADMSSRLSSAAGVSQTADGVPRISGERPKTADVDTAEVSDAMLAMTSRFADIDVFEGARRVEPLVAVDDAGDEFDVKYTSSNLNSGNSPKQPLTLPKKTQGERLMEKPRDRDPPQAQVAPSQRKRLPAPGIGKTLGHGLADTSTVASQSAKTKLQEEQDKVTTNREDILRVLF